MPSTNQLNRRAFLGVAASLPMVATLGASSPLATAPPPVPAADDPAPDAPAPVPSTFPLACMTLPYSQFPLDRALRGIAGAGYKHVAWGTSHREKPGDEKRTPVMSPDAPPAKANELAKRCRELGLEPVMMFSTVYPEHPDALKIFHNRIRQAAAAGIEQVLTFGHTRGGNEKLWVERFKKLAPAAKDHNVTLVIKQHGGDTGTGEACMKIAMQVDHPNVRVNYDAGNVMDYLNVDPIPDIKKCAPYVHSFCIKDHRNFPKDQDCGPGYGEIDHYKLLHPVAGLGRRIPLCCENIFAPVVPRPEEPEGVDALAKRAREYLEVVIKGLGAKVG